MLVHVMAQHTLHLSCSRTNNRYLWPAHFAGLAREYCQIENLTNLKQLPTPHGPYVSCMPIKIKGGSTGWCRVVALVPR